MMNDIPEGYVVVRREIVQTLWNKGYFRLFYEPKEKENHLLDGAEMALEKMTKEKQ